MGILTNFLKLLKPDENDYYNAITEQAGNWQKIDDWAKGIDDSNKKKLDKGNVSVEYDTAKKIEDKIKEVKNEIDEKQNKTDNTLETTAKQIGPAINEIYSLVKKDKGERLPIGTIVPFITDVIPLGYLLCDGREITQQDYPELYDLLPFGGHINEEIFRSLAKNEVPVMSSNNQDNYIISASSEYNNGANPAWRAFDNAINRGWATRSGEKTGWIQIEYPKERALSSFTIRTHDSGGRLKSLIVYGINNEQEEELFNKNFEKEFSNGEVRSFQVTFNTKKYKKFKFNLSNNISDPYTGLDTLTLYTVDMSQFPNANQETNKKYLPDLRNMFLRGNKQDRELLSWQNDDNKRHNHKIGASINYTVSYPQYFYNFISDPSIALTTNLDAPLGDNGVIETNYPFTFTGTESRPQNISVNYIIKAKNISSDDTVTSVIDEVNTKIETNRKGLADLKTEYNNHLRGLNETKVLYSQDKYISQSQTLTLTESIKNFKQIEITVMYSTDQFKSTKIHDVRDLTFNDSISATSNVKDVYINTAYGDIYSKLVFRTNGLNIATFTSNAYISKITGIGRIGGF